MIYKKLLGMNSLNKYDRRYKKCLQLEREFNKVLEIERNLPWTELSKPYQDGWFIHLAFRDHIRSRQDHPVLQEALRACAIKGGTKDPALVSKLRLTKRLDQAYKIFPRNDKGEIPYDNVMSWRAGTSAPYIRKIGLSDYKKLSPAAESWFEEVVQYSKYYYKGSLTMYHCTIPRDWLKVKIKPAMVTHERDVDSNLMSRKKELEDQLRSYWRMCGYGGWRMKYNPANRMREREALKKFLTKEEEDFIIKKSEKEYYD